MTVQANGFRARQPPPIPECPPGWRTGPPDFVGVGAQRSGSTWWYGLVTAHPQVSVVPGTRQELHYFDGFWHDGFTDEDARRYQRYFPRPAGTITGEWTPRYMYDALSPRLLAAAAPDARVLVILRDPVERYRAQCAKHPAASAPGSAAGLHMAADALARGLYVPQLRRLLRFFPKEQVRILQFEACVAATEPNVQETYRFLGLDPDFLPDLVAWSDEAAEPPVSLSPALEADLTATYRDELPSLLALVPELDLALWPSAAADLPPRRIAANRG